MRTLSALATANLLLLLAQPATAQQTVNLKPADIKLMQFQWNFYRYLDLDDAPVTVPLGAVAPGQPLLTLPFHYRRELELTTGFRYNLTEVPAGSRGFAVEDVLIDHLTGLARDNTVETVLCFFPNTPAIDYRLPKCYFRSARNPSHYDSVRVRSNVPEAMDRVGGSGGKPEFVSATSPIDHPFALSLVIETWQDGKAHLAWQSEGQSVRWFDLTPDAEGQLVLETASGRLLITRDPANPGHYIERFAADPLP